MKYKRAILVLSIFILSFIYIIHPVIADKYLIENPYNEGIIRFHVRANSDKEEDQALKLKVRDALLEVMVPKFEDVKSIDQSREIIKENLDTIALISEKVIHENNYNYPVKVSLGMDYFPTRKYGNMVFPQGEYETLMVEIGEGKGQNWWCVMFPPLCFVDVTNSAAVDPENNFEEYVVDESAPPKLKSKTLEIAKMIKDKFEDDDSDNIEGSEELREDEVLDELEEKEEVEEPEENEELEKSNEYLVKKSKPSKFKFRTFAFFNKLIGKL